MINLSEFDIPKESVYGIALLGAMIIEPNNGANMLMKVWIVFSQCYLLFIINIFCQIYLLVIIAEIVQRKAPQDVIGLFPVDNPGAESDGMCNASAPMIFICTCLFVACVIGDLAETMKIGQWLYHMKTESTFKELTLSETEDGEVEIVSGMIRLHKLCSLIFILVPKFVIGVLLAWYGSVFVAISDSNENAFLNTLAIYFICEIDELLFKAFTCDVVQVALSKVPSLKTRSNPKVKKCSLLYGTVIICGLVAFTVFTSVSVTCFCPVCGFNGTSFCSPESLNNAIAKGRKWTFKTCCEDPSDPKLTDVKHCPAWYEAKNMTMPAILKKDLELEKK